MQPASFSRDEKAGDQVSRSNLRETHMENKEAGVLVG